MGGIPDIRINGQSIQEIGVNGTGIRFIGTQQIYNPNIRVVGTNAIALLLLPYRQVVLL